MKLLTLNCHSWQERDQFEKIKVLAGAIKEQSYDVIALQEVSQRIDADHVGDNLKKDNFALVLLEELRKLEASDYQFYWDFSHIGFEIYEEGLAILTKHPIEETHSFYITKSEDRDFWKTRKIVGATIRYYDKLLSFFSCHLGWWEDEDEPFKAQVDQLCTKTSTKRKVFLMGDFNNDANRRGEGYDYLLSKGLYDTYSLAEHKDEGSTVKGKIKGWDENQQDLRIDLIFVNSLVKVEQSKVIFNDINKPVVSDHYGVELQLEI